MGAGKTTIGRQLAKRLAIDFYDSDYEIEQRTGVKISLIFEIEGEEGFRKRESQVINELSALNNVVLSTGGGAILKPENRKVLQENGFIVYLKCGAEMLANRTRGDKRRPLLQGENRLGQIKKILSEREPIYISIADEVVDTESLTIKQIIQRILKLVDTK